jgi:DNA-binding response OmpR family regulator
MNGPILIVEDDATLAQVLRKTLESEGYTVTLARDGKTALELGRQPDWQMIILDLMLPRIGGLEVCQRLRQENITTPIIMLTAYSERSKVELARDAGVTEFCAKPVTATELYKKVYAVINTPRSFIRTNVYFGPDRRRRKNDAYRGKERRENGTGVRASAAFEKASEGAT